MTQDLFCWLIKISLLKILYFEHMWDGGSKYGLQVSEKLHVNFWHRIFTYSSFLLSKER